MTKDTRVIDTFVNQGYKWGFVTDIETESAPPGLNEDIIRLISAKKNEPEWMVEWRLKAYRHWLTMKEPAWANVRYPPIDYGSIVYYSAPKKKPRSLDEVDPKLLETYEKLGIPLEEQKMLLGVAVDAVFDSVSVATTYKEKLANLGIIFCSFSEAIQEHPDLVRKYMGSVVPYTDNFFAALNSAVFSDGSFCYIPAGVRCPMELSTYFRINAAETGQFERTLIIAERGSYVSYLEGCLPAGEQVSVGDCWVNIESLKPGDYVVASNGRKAKVRAVMVRPYRGDMLTIHPISPYNAFRLTPEHPVQVVRRADVLVKRRPRHSWLPEVNTQKLLATEPQYVPAGELQVGDFLVFPKVQAEGHNPKYTPELLKHRQNQHIVVYTADKRMGEVRATEDYFLIPVKRLERVPYEGLVFNLDVEGPNSYLVRGFAVHNCTAPIRDENQLHAAVVELIAHDDATIKYSTIQNWYPGDKDGQGGIYNFVTKRGKCLGRNSHISWTQVETGAAITWKYPSVILLGDNSVGEFYSVALTNNYQQADTGTKMIHVGKNTRSNIVSKGISAGHGQNTYRGLVKILKNASGARNFTQCDSMLIGDKCGAHTFPYIEVKNTTARMEHEASTSRIGEDQIFYCNQRGISREDAVSLIVNGFAQEVIRELPMEFAVEARKLLSVSLEGSVG